MSWLTCHKDYRTGKAMGALTESQRTKLLEKMDTVVKDYQTDKNLIEAGYANDTETMRWLFRKATGKELDFEVNDITIKDARKFDIRRKSMSRDIENLFDKSQDNDRLKANQQFSAWVSRNKTALAKVKNILKK